MKDRLRFIVPNAITAIGLSMGLWAMFSAIRGDLQHAAWLALLCVIVDKLDGSAARLLKASSELGIQMDSLSDMVTFVVTPAVFWVIVLTRPGAGFSQAPQMYIPYISAVVYVIGGAFRLARFNCRDAQEEEGVFHGLPTTMCGALMAALFLTLDLHLETADYAAWIPPLFLALGILMVCDLRLPKLRRRKSKFMNVFQIGNFLLVIPLVILRLLPEYLLLLAVGYIVVGFVVGTRSKSEGVVAEATEDPIEEEL